MFFDQGRVGCVVSSVLAMFHRQLRRKYQRPSFGADIPVPLKATIGGSPWLILGHRRYFVHAQVQNADPIFCDQCPQATLMDTKELKEEGRRARLEHDLRR